MATDMKQASATPATNTAGLTRRSASLGLLQRIRADFEQLYDRLAGSFPLQRREAGMPWGVRVEETEDAVLIRAEAPGFAAGDFDLRLHGNRLVVYATHQTDGPHDGSTGPMRREQRYYEAVLLPAGIDQEHVEAIYRDDILTVLMPKTAEGKGRRICVKN